MRHLAMLAHAGALFLDELAQFSPQVLDTLREPMQEGHVATPRGAAGRGRRRGRGG